MAFKSYLLYGSALLIQVVTAQNLGYSEPLYHIGPSYNTANTRSLGGNGLNLANGLNYAANGISGTNLANTGFSNAGNGLSGINLANTNSNFAGNGIGASGNNGLSNIRVNSVGSSNGLSTSRIGNQGNFISNGGSFQVYSTSPVAPTGISTVTELNLEGPLTISGSLPLLATVGLEGQLPTNGQASVTYSCGNSDIGITSQIGNGSPSYGTGPGLTNSLGLAGPASIGAGRLM